MIAVEEHTRTLCTTKLAWSVQSLRCGRFKATSVNECVANRTVIVLCAGTATDYKPNDWPEFFSQPQPDRYLLTYLLHDAGYYLKSW